VFDPHGIFAANAGGTSGAAGQIDGNRLVFQQFKGHTSDIKFFDLTTRSPIEPARGREHGPVGSTGPRRRATC